MKRLIALILALTLTLACGGAALAVNETSGETEISVVIDSVYEVLIPEDIGIVFNALTTSIGSVGLSSALLEPDHEVVVTAGHGALVNSLDSSETIAYTLKSGDSVFASKSFTAAGSAALSVVIDQSEWDAAAAGNYSDTITFTFTYGEVA